MSHIRVGNAPCSWGALEFAEVDSTPIGYAQMLDELVETGYEGTELGDWGYMPTDPSLLSAELVQRNVTMLGAFVPVAFANPTALAAGVETALRTARLLKAVATSPAPYLILADNNATHPVRTRHAGRVTEAMGLDAASWRTFAQGVAHVARQVQDTTGLKTVFHHHCGGFVETPDEIARLLDLTDPALVGLVLDAGHFVFGSQNLPVEHALRRFGDRIWHVHLKDCEPLVAERSRQEGWDYLTSVRKGVFCELGKGSADLAGLADWLRQRDYQGYVVVEQDVLPGMGTPMQSAQRNREFLRTLGL